MGNRRTMEVLSYGFRTPMDMFEKLESEGEKLTHPAERNDIFNFIVTAAVLGEGVQKYYRTTKPEMVFGLDKKTEKWILPDGFEEWITDTSCFRNAHYWLHANISDSLSICHHVCNATKHFHWRDGDTVKRIGEGAKAQSWGGYWFDKVSPDTYVLYGDANYGILQMRGILTQFYCGLIPYLEEIKQESVEN